MYQQSSHGAPVRGAQPTAPAHVLPSTWQWAPAVIGGGAAAQAQADVPPMRIRDGVAGLAIGLCVLAAALAAGIGFTVRETEQAQEPRAVEAGGDTATPAPVDAKPLQADGHAHEH